MTKELVYTFVDTEVHCLGELLPCAERCQQIYLQTPATNAGIVNWGPTNKTVLQLSADRSANAPVKQVKMLKIRGAIGDVVNIVVWY